MFKLPVAIANTQGPHLHFEVGVGSKVKVIPFGEFLEGNHGQVDPELWFNALLGPVLKSGAASPDWLLDAILQAEQQKPATTP